MSWQVAYNDEESLGINTLHIPYHLCDLLLPCRFCMWSAYEANKLPSTTLLLNIVVNALQVYHWSGM